MLTNPKPLHPGDHFTLPLRSANDVYDAQRFRKRTYGIFQYLLPAQYLNPATGTGMHTIETMSRWHWPEQGLTDARLPESFYQNKVVRTDMPPLHTQSLSAIFGRGLQSPQHPSTMLTQTQRPSFRQVFVHEPYSVPVQQSFSTTTTAF